MTASEGSEISLPTRRELLLNVSQYEARKEEGENNPPSRVGLRYAVLLLGQFGPYQL